MPRLLSSSGQSRFGLGPLANLGPGRIARLVTQPRCAIAWASLESVRIVRITIAPHCTQVWVISSRSSDRKPFSNSAGVMAVIASRCPQCEQGRRKLGRRDAPTSLRCMELAWFRPPIQLRLIARRRLLSFACRTACFSSSSESLSSLSVWVVFYFVCKDNTPNCESMEHGFKFTILSHPVRHEGTQRRVRDSRCWHPGVHKEKTIGAS
jgi:hypothetical protein